MLKELSPKVRSSDREPNYDEIVRIVSCEKTAYTAKGLYDLAWILYKYRRETRSTFADLARDTGISKTTIRAICLGLNPQFRVDNFCYLAQAINHSDTFLLLTAIEKTDLYQSNFLYSFKYPKDLKRLENIFQRKQLLELNNAIAQKLAIKLKGDLTDIPEPREFKEATPFSPVGLAQLGELLIANRVQVHGAKSAYTFGDKYGFGASVYAEIEQGLNPRISPKLFYKLSKMIPYSPQNLMLIALGLKDVLINKSINTIETVQDIFPVVDRWETEELAEAMVVLSGLLD